MRSAEDLLQELSLLDESHGVEAKCASQVDRSLMETVCSFSNEPGLGGGYILLGVKRDLTDSTQPTYVVEGVGDPDKIQSDLASQCASMFNRSIRPRISVEELRNKTVIVVHISEMPPTDKPIFLTKLGLPRGAYRRVGSTDQTCSEDDLVALYAGHQVETFDGAVLQDVDMTDIDSGAIDDYRKQRKAVNADADELSLSDDQLLRALGCAKLENNKLKPTVAGVLLFGTSIALRRCFPMMRIDYIRIPGRQWIEDPDHRFDTLEIRAPLLTAIRRAANTVRDELIQSFSLPDGALAREEEPSIPLRVIREAIVNAIMHRSYRIQGAIQILRYANRLEIRNPGHSIKSEDQLGEPGSEARNPRIAAVLHEVNIAETKGSGIRVMRELMLANNLLPPTFESSRSPDQFVATFLFHHFVGKEDVGWLGGLTDQTLSDEEARALIFVREVGAIDNATYRSINRTDTLNASSHLRRLRDIGVLGMKGSGSQTYYILLHTASQTQASSSSPQLRVPAIHGPGLDPKPSDHHLSADGYHPVADGHHPAADGHHPAADGHHLAADGHHLAADGHHPPGSLSEMPQSLSDRIPSPKARPRKALLRALIIDLCEWRALSSRDIARILGRSDHRKVVRNYLSPMVAEGVLRYTHPTMENHPDQQYVTATKS